MEKLTQRERDCLVAILSVNSEFPIRLSEIANKLSVRSPTALNVIKRLSEKNLIKDKGGMIIVTKEGKKVHKEIIEAHRCFEALLTESGISLDEACKQVRKFDYLIDPNTASKVLSHIGNPKLSKHGRKVIVN